MSRDCSSKENSAEMSSWRWKQKKGRWRINFVWMNVTQSPHENNGSDNKILHISYFLPYPPPSLSIFPFRLVAFSPNEITIHLQCLEILKLITRRKNSAKLKTTLRVKERLNDRKKHILLVIIIIYNHNVAFHNWYFEFKLMFQDRNDISSPFKRDQYLDRCFNGIMCIILLHNGGI